MRSTIEDCFRELVRDAIFECMEEIENLPDDDIDKFVEDPYSFNEYIENIIKIYIDSDIECFNIINNDVRLFQEMIEYIQKDEYDPDYIYNGNVVNMFITFTHFWGREQIMGEDGVFMDMISATLEEIVTERDRQREVKALMPLIINRLAIPNELTQSIMLMVGERC